MFCCYCLLASLSVGQHRANSASSLILPWDPSSPHMSVPSTAQVDWNKRKLSHISFFYLVVFVGFFFPVAHLGKVLWSLGAKCSMCSTLPLWEWCLGRAAWPSWGISALLQTVSTDSHATKILIGWFINHSGLIFLTAGTLLLPSEAIGSAGAQSLEKSTAEYKWGGGGTLILLLEGENEVPCSLTAQPCTLWSAKTPQEF